MNRPSDRVWLRTPAFQEAVGRAVAAAVAEYFEVAPPRMPPPLPEETIAPVVAPRPAVPAVIACVGDPSGAENAAYALRLQARLNHRPVDRRQRVVSVSPRCDTVEEALEHWKTHVVALRPAYVLLAFGLHDLCRDDSGASRVPLDRFEAALQEAVRRTRALGAIPILVTLAPIEEAHFHRQHPRVYYAREGGVQPLRDAYNTAIRRVARRTGARLADVSLAAWQREGEWLGGAEPGESGVSLSPTGLERLVDVLLGALAPPG